MQGLKDKVAVITGAGMGLGRALADVLHEEGAKLALGDVVDEVKEVARELHALAVIADVTNESEVNALAEIAVKEFGRINIWINNAGVWLPHGPIEEVPANRLGSLDGRGHPIRVRVRGPGRLRGRRPPGVLPLVGRRRGVDERYGEVGDA